MNLKTYELNLVQVEEAFSKSKTNKYSDHKKNNHFSQLHELFLIIKETDYTQFTVQDISEHKFIFDYLFKCLEFLDDSTLNTTPYEIVSCLDKALKDWVLDEKFIIVTSLSNKINHFSLESYGFERINLLKKIIKNRYDLNLNYRLIKINLPRTLVRDYLTSVVLYHELGHFIDSELNITNRMFFKKYSKSHFHINNREEFEYLHYKREYFADLFAAQYIANSSNNYLNHIAYKEPNSEKHPATDTRVKVVEDFLCGYPNDEVTSIQEILNEINKEKFKIRFELIPSDNNGFIKLVPHEINNDQKLHAIFKLGWDLWLDSENNFLKRFSRRRKYHIINNLIEKSISTYNTIETWKQIK